MTIGRGKKPLFSNWPSFKYNGNDPEPAIPRAYVNSGKRCKMPHFNTGVSTLGLVTFDIDITGAEAAMAFRRAIEAAIGRPADFVRFRKDSSKMTLFYGVERGATWQYAVNGAVCTTHGNIDIDANHPGQFVCLHGIHSSGALIEFDGDKPWDVPQDQLTT